MESESVMFVQRTFIGVLLFRHDSIRALESNCSSTIETKENFSSTVLTEIVVRSLTLNTDSSKCV